MVRYVFVHLRKNPTLCISFAYDPVWTQALQNSPDAVRTMLRDMSNDYVVHAVVCAPDNAPPPLGTDRLLLYSKAQGRAMLARALTPQCHVECVFVDEAGNVAWDSSDDIPAYLARLEQLAQVVDKLVVAVIPCAASSTTVSFASLERAFQQHSLSKFAHVEMHKVSPNDPWTSLTHHLAYLRSQVWT